MAQPGTDEKWTIGRLIQWTTDYLKKKGSESPRLDTEVLLAHVLGRPRVQLYTGYEEEIGEGPRARFKELVKKRIEGMPVAYLVGKKEFYALTFRVSPDVLIPRPESEYLVLEFLTVFKGREDVLALDVGTGSGCLSIACLRNHKSCRFLATDLSEAAVAVARANAEELGVGDRYRVEHGSLYEPVREDGPFDAILSNPPYLRSDEIPGLERDVRDFEPVSALDGGKDGLRLIEPLVRGAGRLLKPDGRLFIEFGFAQADEVRRLVEAQEDLSLVAIVKDGANHPRVLHARRSV